MFHALAIETSSRTGSVAIVRGDEVAAEESFPHGLQNAAQIVVIIDRLSRALGIGPPDFAELYVSIGPGSFTGLRVGVTVAKAIAAVTGATIRAIPSAEVVVRNIKGDWQDALVVLDAKRDQVFASHFVRDGPAIGTTSGPILDRLDEILIRLPRPIHLIGEGVEFHRRFIPSSDLESGRIVLIGENASVPRAAVLARLGLDYRLAGKGQVTPEALVPLYVRLPEAEEKWRKQSSGS